MRKKLLAGIVLLACAGWLDPERSSPAQQKGSDPRQLIGVWRGYVVDGRGENSDRGPVHLEVTFTADKITARNLQDGGKSLGEGTYRIDLTKRLQEIDTTGVVVPDTRQRPYPGIFQVEGNTLRWCVNRGGKERPTEFVTRRGQYLLVLQRQGRATGQ
jgi:uncharacterized protein (TIGR03067 family)